MNKLTNDTIALDTNVLEHLLDKNKDRRNHIRKLLGCLWADSVRLLVDDNGKILDEYVRRLKHRLKKAIERKDREICRELVALRWIDTPRRQEKVHVEKQSELWRLVDKHSPIQRPRTDRYFIYVAFAKGRVLVTNDNGIHAKKKDLMRGPAARARREIQKNNGVAEDKSDILSSLSAEEKC